MQMQMLMLMMLIMLVLVLMLLAAAVSTCVIHFLQALQHAEDLCAVQHINICTDAYTHTNPCHRDFELLPPHHKSLPDQHLCHISWLSFRARKSWQSGLSGFDLGAHRWTLWAWADGLPGPCS